MWDLIMWLSLMIVLTVIELATVNLVTVWFAIAAGCSSILAVFKVDMIIQVIVFAIVATVLLIFTRPIVKKVLIKKTVPTNADMLIGKEACVVTDIDKVSGSFRVHIMGLDWSGKLLQPDEVTIGEKLLVDKIEGATLILKKTKVTCEV